MQTNDNQEPRHCGKTGDALMAALTWAQAALSLFHPKAEIIAFNYMVENIWAERQKRMFENYFCI